MDHNKAMGAMGDSWSGERRAVRTAFRNDNFLAVMETVVMAA